MPGTKNIFGPEEAVFAFFRLLLGTVICPKMTLSFTKKIFWQNNLPKPKNLTQNLTTWATFPYVLLHKIKRKILFLLELTHELKIKPGTKKSQELNLVAQELSY